MHDNKPLKLYKNKASAIIIVQEKLNNNKKTMDPRTIQYEGWLRTLRYILLAQGIILFVVSLFFGRINGFIYIFVILNSIFLFCEINLKTTYQSLIVIGLFVFVKEIIQFLMFLFYQPEYQKQLDPIKPIIMYIFSIFVMLKLILVTWRHYQNKIMTNINSGENLDFMEDF